MKSPVLGVMSVVLLSLAFSSPASAWTCKQRAAACMKNSGDPACNDPTRLASCARTGSYVSPKGYSWPVSGGKSK